MSPLPPPEAIARIDKCVIRACGSTTPRGARDGSHPLGVPGPGLVLMHCGLDRAFRTVVSADPFRKKDAAPADPLLHLASIISDTVDSTLVSYRARSGEEMSRLCFAVSNSLHAARFLAAPHDPAPALKGHSLSADLSAPSQNLFFRPCREATLWSLLLVSAGDLGSLLPLLNLQQSQLSVSRLAPTPCATRARAAILAALTDLLHLP